MMTPITFTAPEHWACALVYGDESSFDYYDDPKDRAEYEACIQDLVERYGNAHVVGCSDEPSCTRYADYGIRGLLGNVLEYTILVDEGTQV